MNEDDEYPPESHRRDFQPLRRHARITIDLDVCQGHGVCYLSSDELFAIRETDGRAIALLDPVPDRLIEAAKKIANACPEQAIVIVEK